MRRRRGRDRLHELCSGPARLVQALGITREHNGADLTRKPLYIVKGEVREDPDHNPVGIREGAELPLRFYLEGSQFISGSRTRQQQGGNIIENRRNLPFSR